MNILIVSATEFEVLPLTTVLKIDAPLLGLNQSNVLLNNHHISVLITGIGMVNTAFMMGRFYEHNFDLIINVGICGAFNKTLNLGEVVLVTTDVLSELGAQDGDDFLTYDKLNLPGKHMFNGIHHNHYNYLNNLKQVKAITVNTIHGNEFSIEKVKQLYTPDVESMEGAAFFASAESTSANVLQIRSISNYVEKRDKSKWKMPEAINNLNDFIINFITQL